MTLDQMQEVLMEGLALVLGETEESNLPDRDPGEEAIDHFRKGSLDVLTARTTAGSVKGMHQETAPSLFDSQRQIAANRLAGSLSAGHEVLPHHGAVNDGCQRQIPPVRHDHLAQSDRPLPHRGQLDVRPGGLLHFEGRPGRHPQVIVRRNKQGIRLRPAGRRVLDLDPRLDEME